MFKLLRSGEDTPPEYVSGGRGDYMINLGALDGEPVVRQFQGLPGIQAPLPQTGP